MLNNKALHILRTFSKSEVKEFKELLETSYFNKSGRLKKFFNSLNKLNPTFQEDELSQKDLMEVNKLSETRYDDIFADLYLKVIEFLELKNYKDSTTRKLDGINELYTRKFYKLCKKEIVALEKKISKEYYISDFYIKFILENKKYDLNRQNPLNIIKGDEKFEQTVDNIWKLSENSFYFFFLNLLRAYTIVYVDCWILEKNIEETELGIFFHKFFPLKKIHDLVYGELSYKDKFLSNIIKLEWLHFQITLGIDVPKNFKEYKRLLKLVDSKIHVDIRYNYYLIAHRLFRYGVNHIEFWEEERDFYKEFLRRKVYKTTDSEFINLRLFQYFCFRGLYSKDYAFMEYVIDNHIDSIPDIFHDTVKDIKDACFLIFKDNKPADAVPILKNVKHHNDIICKRDLRSLTLIALYDSKQYENALKKHESFQKSIKRQRIPNQEKTFFNKFLYYALKLINNKLDFEEDLGYLKKEISNEQYLPYKYWFIEKINEIKANKS